MAPVNGNADPRTRSNSFTRQERTLHVNGTSVANRVVFPQKGFTMNSVVSVTLNSKPASTYVRCPSCQVKVWKVHAFISRMIWDRFRCSCGYDGPLEYVAAVRQVGSKLQGA